MLAKSVMLCIVRRDSLSKVFLVGHANHLRCCVRDMQDASASEGEGVFATWTLRTRRPSGQAPEGGRKRVMGGRRRGGARTTGGGGRCQEENAGRKSVVIRDVEIDFASARESRGRSVVAEVAAAAPTEQRPPRHAPRFLTPCLDGGMLTASRWRGSREPRSGAAQRDADGDENGWMLIAESPRPRPPTGTRRFSCAVVTGVARRGRITRCLRIASALRFEAGATSAGCPCTVGRKGECGGYGLQRKRSALRCWSGVSSIPLEIGQPLRCRRCSTRTR